MRSLTVAMLLAPIPSHSGDAEEDAIKVFGEEALRTAATEFAKKQADRLVQQQLGETAVDTWLADSFGDSAMRGSVSQIFATYNLYHGIRNFTEADKRTGRYAAATQTVAAAVSFVNPAIGTLVSFSGLGSQIVGDVATKKDQEKLLETYRETTALLKFMMLDIEAIAFAEAEYVQALLVESAFATKRYAIAEKYLLDECNPDGTEFQKNIFRCFDVAMTAHFEMLAAADLIQRVLEFDSGLISLEKYLNATQSDLTVAKYTRRIADARAKLAKKNAELPAIIDKVSLLAMTNVRVMPPSAFDLEKQCQLEVGSYINSIAKLHLRTFDPYIRLSETNALLNAIYRSVVAAKLLISECSQAVPDSESWQKKYGDVLERLSAAAFAETLFGGS